jgi:hypothetical protein
VFGPDKNPSTKLAGARDRCVDIIDADVGKPMRGDARWQPARRTAAVDTLRRQNVAALINPRHPSALAIAAKVLRLFEYNRLFRS